MATWLRRAKQDAHCAGIASVFVRIDEVRRASVLPHLNGDIFQRVAAAIQHAVLRARNAILACGRRFPGRAGVLSHSFRERAESFEPRRGPIPKVRVRNRSLLSAMLARYSVFWADYRAALEAWRAGDRSVEFPFGT